MSLLDPNSDREIRLEGCKIVERAVRPVRAGIERKRRMRNELLAHLSGIYEHELARGSDPADALRQAGEQFGDPDELAEQLQRALPFREKWNHRLELWLGWRAPEHAVRWMGRMAMHWFVILAATAGFAATVTVMRYGWTTAALIAIRPIIGMAIVMPLTQFLLGTLYFEMRDHVWGVFGSRKSNLVVIGLGVLVAICAVGLATSFFAIAGTDKPLVFLGRSCFLGPVCPVWFYFVARHHGPVEIADTNWACLDISHGDGDRDNASQLVPA